MHWKFVGLLIATFVTCAHATALDRPPNIVLIVADDLGWTDPSYMTTGFLASVHPALSLPEWREGRAYYQTPSIDSIARRGVTLTAFYACQNCAPTRAALMSGQYAPRTGVYTVGTLARGKEADRRLRVPSNRTRLPLACQTIAQALQRAGYATGIFGKWHLGSQGPYHPLRRGFDEAAVTMGRYYNFRVSPPRTVPEGVYLTDYLTDLAVSFIERHRSRPFFLYLAHFAVHVPLRAKPDLIERYRGRRPVGGHRNPVYAAMIASLDESVGRVLVTLERLDLTRNTLVIFTSDNGGVGGYAVPGTGNRKGITDNWPLREGKGALYEGGIRVPFFASWPGHIPSGVFVNTPAHVVDLFPTLLSVAGVDRPEGYTLDGVDLVPMLLNGETQPRRSPIFWHFPGYLESYIPERTWRTTPVSVVRSGRWKLMRFYESGELELYDVVADMRERVNLAQERAEVRGNLEQLLDRWIEETQAVMPTPKEP